MVTARTVCAKTPKGQEEVERRAHGLSPRLRQMLIMMDGRRDVVALQAVFPPELVPGLVQQLIDGGFVTAQEHAPAASPVTATAPRAAPPSAPAPLAGVAAGEEDPFELGQTFMINLARRILGIAGDGIVAKLRQAQDIDGLRALYLEWRNTIKQAPDGLLRLKELEKKLSKVLGELPTAGS
jgi:hypothetical protein